MAFRIKEIAVQGLPNVYVVEESLFTLFGRGYFWAEVKRVVGVGPDYIHTERMSFESFTDALSFALTQERKQIKPKTTVVYHDV